MDILLSVSTTPVIGWIAWLLGKLMEGIYFVLDVIGIPNIGLAIIIFTIIAYAIQTPIQIRQQKFSKMGTFMQPELTRIQEKYKNKKDQNSQMKQQEEMMSVYQKYGVSPMGQCLPMIFQMLVMFSLYQVIMYMPGYISRVKDMFDSAVSAVSSVNGFSGTITQFMKDHAVSFYAARKFGDTLTHNNLVDFFYALKPADWSALGDVSKFASIKDVLTHTARTLDPINRFFGMNITQSPMNIIRANWADKNYLMVFAGVMVPFLAWLTQWLSYKLMPQSPEPDPKQQQGGMAGSMKMMNTIMPFTSAIFCITLSVGIGIYWIAGAAVRSIQQIVINRHLSAMELETEILKNQEKLNKKRIKAGLPPQKITKQALMNVRNIQEPAPAPAGLSEEEKKKRVEESTAYYKKSTDYKEGSIASKANMVSQFDEKKKKKR